MLANSNCMLYCYWSVGTASARQQLLFRPTNNNRACNLNSRGLYRSGVCGVTDQRFHNSRGMFEFYATKSCLFLLKAMYVMRNLSNIMDLLILWRLDALFGCGRANSEVDAWSGER